MQVVLLVNLGSPNELTISSIRLFLRKFLADRRVVGLSRIVWYPILYGIILPIRAKFLLGQYRHIWLNSSSPLIYYTQLQQSKLQGKFSGDRVIAHAFSYAKPEIKNVLGHLHRQINISRLTILPLYPQFSSTTTSVVFDQVSDFYIDKKFLPELKFIRDFHSNDNYISAIASSITEHFLRHGKPERLIFSYHSLPLKIIQSGDKYLEECLNSSALIVAKLSLKPEDYVITFQSRFGGAKWLTPATADVVADLAKDGIRHIAVVCPGFISDCLETLEEIDVTNRNIFMNNGGDKYHYIPCLNDSDRCINLLHQIIKE